MSGDNLARDSTQQRLFLFTDVVDSVGFKTQYGNVAYKEEYRWLDEQFRRIVASVPGGEILQDLGDGRLCTFGTSSGAVQAALMLQYCLAQKTWRLEPLTVRVGIHFGEVNLRETGTYSGLAIDTAARVMGLACGRQILMTRMIYDDARAYVLKHPSVDGAAVSLPIRWVSHGEYLFKGLGQPHEIFEVFAEGIGPGQPPPNSEKARRVDSDDLTWRPKAGEAIPYRTPTWTLKQALGAGGFGEVWLAERGAAQNVFKFCFDAERLVALRREVELFSRMNSTLGDRNDIQHVLDYHFDDAPPYYVQYDYAGGGSLIDWFKTQGGIDNVPLETRLDFVRQVAVALDAAHSAGVLHLDIKPANILLRADGHGGWRTVLADFGMGKVNSEMLVQQKSQSLGAAIASGGLDTSGGTMAYMAPELIDLKPPTTRSDIYSLGVFFYQMVVGRIKALAPGWEHDISDPLLRRDIADCVAGDPERRLGSARELADRIQHLPKRRSRALWKRLRRRATIGAAIAAVLAIPLVTSMLYERERRLKLAASDLFHESVGTIRSVFNEALSDELRDLPELVKLRRNLVSYCQSFTQRNEAYLAKYPEYDGLFEEFGDEVRALDPKLGVDLYGRAIAYQAVLQSAHRSLPVGRLPQLHVKRGELRTDLGDRDARSELEEAASALRHIIDVEPSNPAFQLLLGECYHTLAYNFQALDGRFDKAKENYHLSQKYFEQLVQSTCPAEGTGQAHENQVSITVACADYLQALARSHGYQGDLYLEANDQTKAKAAYDEALAIRKRLVEAFPREETRRFELARSYQNSGRLAAWSDQVDEAIANFHRAREMQLSLHEEKPSVVKFKTDLIFSCNSEVELLLDKEQYGDVQPAIDLAARMSVELPDSLDALRAKAGTALVLARQSVFSQQADSAEKIAVARKQLHALMSRSVSLEQGAQPSVEQCKDPSMAYDMAVIEALSAANSQADRDDSKSSIVRLIGLAAGKGYRDVNRYRRDRAFRILGDAERLALSEVIATANEGNNSVRQ